MNNFIRWVNEMKRFDDLLKRVIVIHLIFLLVAQWLVNQPIITPYIVKLTQYEGVATNSSEGLDVWKNITP